MLSDTLPPLSYTVRFVLTNSRRLSSSSITIVATDRLETTSASPTTLVRKISNVSTFVAS